MAGERDDVVVALARGAAFQLVRKVRAPSPSLGNAVPVFLQECQYLYKS